MTTNTTPLTWLAFLNFVGLQWLGVRLARKVNESGVTTGWCVLRWVWPLTGWWSDFRWIHRRNKVATEES